MEGKSEQSGWRRAWIPWAVGLLLVLLGAGAGWASTYYALKPLLGEPVQGKVQVDPATLRDAARVEDPPSGLSAQMGDQVEVAWRIANVGESTWAVDTYRFVPDAEELTVVPLPHRVSPGSWITIRTVVTVPPEHGLWQPAWDLVGPKGAVPGGRVRVTIRLSPG